MEPRAYCATCGRWVLTLQPIRIGGIDGARLLPRPCADGRGGVIGNVYACDRCAGVTP